ncbi:hypothetical protein Taro_022001 [Colocasia esculenta]|uniref:Uncharacterized protein n=1 Tax=Colocasia esculenta TaxID=4460 RepID=A0A843UT65_COLES|nr:hypothetical protein [Colocasia esculenta]
MRIFSGHGMKCMHGLKEIMKVQVKSRVGPEMKQELLLFSWSWRLGVAVDWLASRLVDVDCLNLAAVDVDAKGGGCYWRHRG